MAISIEGIRAQLAAATAEVQRLQAALSAADGGGYSPGAANLIKRHRLEAAAAGGGALSLSKFDEATKSMALEQRMELRTALLLAGTRFVRAA